MSRAMRLVRIGVAAVALACSSGHGAPAVGQGGSAVAEAGTGTASAAGRASTAGGGGAATAEGGHAGGGGASEPSWLDVPGSWSEPQLLDQVGNGGDLWAARNEDGSILAVWRVGDANLHRWSVFREGAWSVAQDFDTGFAATDPRLVVRVVPGPPGVYYVQLSEVIRPWKDGAWQPALDLPEVQAFDVDDAGRLLVAFLKKPPAGSTYMQLYVGFQDDVAGAFLFEGEKLPAAVAVRALPGGQWLVTSNGSYRSFDGATWSEAASLPAAIDRDHTSFGSDGRMWIAQGSNIWTYLPNEGFQRSAVLVEASPIAEQQVVPIAAERGVALYTRGNGNAYLHIMAAAVDLSGTVTEVVERGTGGRLRGTSDLKGGAHFTYEFGGGTMPAGIYTQRYLANQGWSRPVLLLPRYGAIILNSINLVFPDPDGSAQVVLRTQDNTIKTLRFTPAG